MLSESESGRFIVSYNLFIVLGKQVYKSIKLSKSFGHASNLYGYYIVVNKGNKLEMIKMQLAKCNQEI